MKSQVEIKDKNKINEILKSVEYGTLALCKNNKPYSVPINYVYKNEFFYFHGSKKGKKMDFIKDNPDAFLSIVEPFSMIQSYFSSTDNLACPATHFFQSISCEGIIEIVSDYDEKVLALQSLMEKLQPEGKHKHLSDELYTKMIKATEVFKLIPSDIKGKVKLGQHLPKERFDMIVKHLETRDNKIDKNTIEQMKNIKLEEYLKEDEIINFSHTSIQSLAKKLSKDCINDEAIAKNCFLYVRDKINHSGDYKDDITTLKASDVLEHKTGWCYAKSHLLAALLRANDIPTGFCYQRLSCGKYKDDIYCLHGLNAIYLKKHGWYKIDARGNKEGVDAQFSPPYEKLAFEIGEGEYDIDGIFDKPLDVVVDSLAKYKTYEEVKDNIPDIE